MEGDRRLASRALHRLRVLVEGDVVFTADVTANGFCLETQRLAQRGAAISGRITVGEREFEFTGMVCWTREDDARHTRMGVRFLDISQEFRDELETLH
jgi:hypothetical protein